MENTTSKSSAGVWTIYGTNYVNNYMPTYAPANAVRPVIEVKKTDIDF